MRCYSLMCFAWQCIVRHCGSSVGRGHYIADVQGTVTEEVSRGSAPATVVASSGIGGSGLPAEVWKRHDDSTVQEVSKKDVVKCNDSTAYLIFYSLVE